MNPSNIYIAIALLVLLIVVVVLFFNSKNKKPRKFSALAGLAFAFVLAGILFGENKFVGYCLIGIGLILAIIDIVRKSKK